MTLYRSGPPLRAAVPHHRCPGAKARPRLHVRRRLRGPARWADLLPAGAAPLPAGPPRPAFGPTGPDLLAYAAHLLPVVMSPFPRYGEVHALLYEALGRLGAGVDRHHRLRLCDEARDMLAAYLVATGVARPASRASATMRGWIIGAGRAEVRAALAGAARFWRRELEPAATRTGAGPVCRRPCWH